MSELIDREDADYDLEKLQADAIIRGNRQYSHGIRDARKLIAEQPTVDSVVHCKHCKNKSTAECPFYLWGVMNPDDNDYCSCGEMDEGAEDK